MRPEALARAIALAGLFAAAAWGQSAAPALVAYDGVTLSTAQTISGAKTFSATLLSTKATGTIAIGILTGARIVFNSGTNTRYMYDDGSGVAVEGGQLHVDLVQPITSNQPLALRSTVTDGATAIGFKFAPLNTLSNATAIVARFYNDNLSTGVLDIGKTGKLGFGSGDSSASPGNATIHSASGKAAVANGAGSVTITSNITTTSSFILVSPIDYDANCQAYKVVTASGSFTLTCNGNAGANWKFAFLVLN